MTIVPTHPTPPDPASAQVSAPLVVTPSFISKLMRDNMAQRLLTSMIFLPIVVVASVLGGWVFTLLILPFAAIAVLEFYGLAAGRPSRGIAPIGLGMVIISILSFHFGQPLIAFVGFVLGGVVALIVSGLRFGSLPRALETGLMTLAGGLYVGLPTSFLVAIRALPIGFIWILVVFALTWGTDTMAYVGGRLWGKTRLAPALSPKKTVEGAIVGYFGGLFPALIVLALNGLITPATVILCVVGPLVAILGDLMESGLKRAFNVKDSHISGFNIFPGHGGVLDRTDALIAVSNYSYIGLVILGIAAASTAT